MLPLRRSISTSRPSLGAGTGRVRTRIVLDDLGKDEEGMMSTRNWLDEDDRDLSQRALSTLSPAHLQHSDYIGLSHWQWPSVCFIPRTPSFSLRFHKKDQTSQPFPKGTRGFLYYYAPPNHLPPMAGGVRFRITPSGNPATFQKGVDLLHDGLPWQIPLHTIACAVGDFEILRKQLLLERLVTQADLDQCLAATPNKKRLDHRTTLYGLNQPFPVAFHRAQSATVVGSAGLKRWSYSYTFADNRMQHRPLARPYAGAALAQFERSPLPQHAGTQTLVLRITKMLAPPTCTLPRYDGYIPPPAEGALVRRPMGHARAVSLQPWHCDVAGASESAAALRMLLENGPV